MTASKSIPMSLGNLLLAQFRVASGQALSWQLVSKVMLRPGVDLLEGRSWGFPHASHSSPPHTLQRTLCFATTPQPEGHLSVPAIKDCGYRVTPWYQHRTMVHSNVKYKDMEGGKIAQCWTKHFSSLQFWSHSAVLYIILVCKASAGEQKAAFAMEIGIPDKRSENTLLRGELLISSNKISWKLYQIKKIIENVSVFNRHHEKENNPMVNSMKNSQVQAHSEGQKWRFISCE